MKADFKDVKKFLREIQQRHPKIVKKTLKRFNNNQAFEVKKLASSEINSKLDIKKARAKKSLNRAIYVDKKPKTSAVVGVLRYDNQYKNSARYYLKRMFFGENIKQISKSGHFRRTVYFTEKKLTTAIMKNSYNLPKRLRGLPKSRQLAIGISMARQHKKKYLFTADSIYKINRKRLAYFGAIRKANEVKSKKIDVISPTIKKVLARSNKLFLQAYKYELKKLKK